MKTRMLSWIQMECDLSEYPEDLSNYVLDQVEDRLDDLSSEEVEIERDYENRKLKITSPLIDLIQRIIEEKQADMNFERRASTEALEAGLGVVE